MARGRKLRPLLGPTLHPLTDHVTPTMQGLATIRADGRTKAYHEYFFDLYDLYICVGLHIQIGTCWTIVRSGLLGSAFVTATASAIVYRDVDAATAGFTMTLALQTLATLLSQTATIGMGVEATDRVLSLAEIPREPAGGLQPDNWLTDGALHVKDLSVLYGPDLPPVLKNISFAAEPRQRLGIVGRTGAGKSSISNVFLRFIESSSGHILSDGIDTSRINLEQLRCAIKLIPQDPFFFSGTLQSNIDP